MSRPNSTMRVDEDLSRPNENSLIVKNTKSFGNVQAGKAGTSGAAARKFGTSLSANIQPSGSALAIGKSIAPSSMPVPPRPILASCIQNYQPIPPSSTDSITAADIAGAMDIDIADRFNELAVTDYVDDIYANLRLKEMELAPPVNYMISQEDINEKMRAILVDWLIEVHLKFKLRHETLFLTVNILDRFLAVQKVARQRLQVKDYVYICDNAYTREQIIQMEQLILAKLNFRLTVPTQRSYLKRFCKAAQGDARLLMLTSYMMELTLVDLGSLAFRPSELCAAATHLALRLLSQRAWTPTLVKYTRFVPGDLAPAAAHIQRLHARAAEPGAAQRAAYKKYASDRFHAVAAIRSAESPVAV